MLLCCCPIRAIYTGTFREILPWLREELFDPEPDLIPHPPVICKGFVRWFPDLLGADEVPVNKSVPTLQYFLGRRTDIIAESDYVVILLIPVLIEGSRGVAGNIDIYLLHDPDCAGAHPDRCNAC